MTLTLALVKEFLRYEPDTGRWFWLKSPAPNAPVGSEAGWVGPQGRTLMRIRGHQVLGARLAWFYMTGGWPKKKVDHKNRNPADDRWENLRPATIQENCRNAGRRSDNSSGYKGVSRDHGKWRARITLAPGRTIHLGHFETREAAGAAYAAAAEKHFGEFACASPAHIHA